MKKQIIIAGILGILIFAGIGVASQIESGVAIYKGWNLIYGFTPNSLQGQSFEFSHIKAIYAYVPTDNEYIRMYPNPENSKIDKFGDSYFEKQVMWVYSDATVEGELNGHAHFTEYWLEEPAPLSQRPLYKGWNFVGITLDMTGKTFEEIKGNCDIERIFFWHSEDQSWDSLFNKGLGQNLNGGIGTEDKVFWRGIVIKVSADCKMGATESGVPSVPQLPPLAP